MLDVRRDENGVPRADGVFLALDPQNALAFHNVSLMLPSVDVLGAAPARRMLNPQHHVVGRPVVGA